MIQREDDRPEAIRVRMHAYEACDAPLLDFYRRRGLLIEIEAGGSAVETCERTLAALEAPAPAETRA